MKEVTDRKPCGCSLQSIKCLHFDDDGSSLQVIKFSKELIAEVAEKIDIRLPTFCIQYTPHGFGEICTGDDFEDEAEALAAFEALVSICRDDPTQRQLLGAFVLAIAPINPTQ